MDSCVDWHSVDQGVDGAAYVRSLATLRKGARGTVISVGIECVAGMLMGDEAGSSVVRRLLEIGFVPGEQLEVIEEIRPGGDPIAVRIGSSIFALRREVERA